MTSGSTEPAAARLRRLSMRSWRRGTREMDLILGPFADQHLAAMSKAETGHYEALLEEADQDLFPWISGALPAPARFAALIRVIADFAMTRHNPRN